MRLSALIAARPGELRFAAGSEIEGIDFADPSAPAAIWRIRGKRMKGDEERKAEGFGNDLVPLAPAEVEILRAARQLSGGLLYIFSGERQRQWIGLVAGDGRDGWNIAHSRRA